MMALGVGAGRRSHHQHLLVLRDRRLHRASRRDAAARRHRSRRPTTSRRRPSGPRCRRARRRSFPSTSTASAPTWIRCWRLPARRACRSSKMPVRRSAPPTRAVRPGRWGRLAASRSFPARTSARSATAGWSRPTMRRWRASSRRLRNHGSETKYYHQQIGGNFRLDALQAAVLRVKLPHLATWTAMRRENAATLPPSFWRRCCLARRSSCRSSPTDCFHIYNQFVVRVPDRDRVRAFLTDHGVGTEVYYPVPFHLQECFAVARLSPRRFSGRRIGRGLDAGAAHLRRADRRTTGDRRPDACRRACAMTPRRRA